MCHIDLSYFILEDEILDIRCCVVTSANIFSDSPFRMREVTNVVLAMWTRGWNALLLSSPNREALPYGLKKRNKNLGTQW